MERLSTPLCAVYFASLFLTVQTAFETCSGRFFDAFFFLHFLKSYPAKSEITKDFKKKLLFESQRQKLLRDVYLENNYDLRKCSSFEPLIVSSKIYFFLEIYRTEKEIWDQNFSRKKRC